MVEQSREEWPADAPELDPEQDPPRVEAPAPNRQCPASPAASGPVAPRLTADQVADHCAGHLAESCARALMYLYLAGVFRQADALSFRKFRDKLLADCGGPT